MNPHIRELAEQAGFGIAGNPEYIHAMDYDGMCTDKLEKFAELIVQECAQVADTERPGYLGCGYITKTTGMRIKEHFGVDG